MSPVTVKFQKILLGIFTGLLLPSGASIDHIEY